jgi:uncharacterized membrane protein (DUF106 family)
MDYQIYVVLVAVVAIIYATFTRFLQRKLVDKTAMQNLQKRSKTLNEEYKKASEKKDQKKMEKIMKEQMELFPEMNKAMMSQMKPMFVIIIAFLIIMSAINALDPTKQDDFKLTVLDDGSGCDKEAGDGKFTTCYNLPDGEFGKWTITAKAFDGGRELGTNQTHFIYNAREPEDRYSEDAQGEGMVILTDKEEYFPGEKVKITVIPANKTKGFGIMGIRLGSPEEMNVDKVEVELSKGTYFRVELPFEIPIFSVKTIYQPHWWFVLISFISGIAISLIISKVIDKK